MVLKIRGRHIIGSHYLRESLIPRGGGGHLFLSDDEIKEDEEITMYELDFLNEPVHVVPIVVAYHSPSGENKASTKESYSNNDLAPISSIL